jgi:hypothetical protein
MDSKSPLAVTNSITPPFGETEPFDSPFQELRHKRPKLAEAPVVSLVVKSPVSSLLLRTILTSYFS